MLYKSGKLKMNTSKQLNNVMVDYVTYDIPRIVKSAYFKK